jgi:hypothetical protein
MNQVKELDCIFCLIRLKMAYEMPGNIFFADGFDLFFGLLDVVLSYNGNSRLDAGPDEINWDSLTRGNQFDILRVATTRDGRFFDSTLNAFQSALNTLRHYHFSPALFNRSSPQRALRLFILLLQSLSKVLLKRIRKTVSFNDDFPRESRHSGI